MKNNHLACAVLAALLSIQTLPAFAAKPDTASTVGTPSQSNPAPADAGLPANLAEQMVVGPAVIDLGNQAKLKLPETFAKFPKSPKFPPRHLGDFS